MFPALRSLVTVTVIALVTVWGSLDASGEEAALPGPARTRRLVADAPVAPPASIKVTTPAGGKAMPAPPYQSLMRERCEDELRRDAMWKASLRELVRREVRTQDAEEFLRNKRHMIMAYAAIWLLTVAFLVIMWRRQRGFEAEIVRLRGELEGALDD